MRRSLCLLALAPVFLAGCDGVTFRNETVQNLPNDFTNRTPLDNTASYRFHLDQQIGAIVAPDTAHPGRYKFVGKTLLPAGFTPIEEQLDRNNNGVYSSKITSGAAATAGIASTFNLSIDADNSKELTIVDIARSEVPTNKLDAVEAQLLVEKTNKGAAKEYWIKSLLLSQIVIKSYTSEKSDASASGPAFGAPVNGKTSVYATNDIASQDFYLGADLIDLDDVGVVGSGIIGAPTTPLRFVEPKPLGRITLVAAGGQ